MTKSLGETLYDYRMTIGVTVGLILGYLVGKT
jgi:hypothetical protein